MNLGGLPAGCRATAGNIFNLRYQILCVEIGAVMDFSPNLEGNQLTRFTQRITYTEVNVHS